MPRLRQAAGHFPFIEQADDFIQGVEELLPAPGYR